MANPISELSRSLSTSSPINNHISSQKRASPEPASPSKRQKQVASMSSLPRESAPLTLAALAEEFERGEGITEHDIEDSRPLATIVEEDEAAASSSRSNSASSRFSLPYSAITDHPIQFTRQTAALHSARLSPNNSPKNTATSSPSTSFGGAISRPRTPTPSLSSMSSSTSSGGLPRLTGPPPPTTSNKKIVISNPALGPGENFRDPVMYHMNVVAKMKIALYCRETETKRRMAAGLSTLNIEFEKDYAIAAGLVKPVLDPVLSNADKKKILDDFHTEIETKAWQLVLTELAEKQRGTHHAQSEADTLAGLRSALHAVAGTKPGEGFGSEGIRRMRSVSFADPNSLTRRDAHPLGSEERARADEIHED